MFGRKCPPYSGPCAWFWNLSPSTRLFPESSSSFTSQMKRRLRQSFLLTLAFIFSLYNSWKSAKRITWWEISGCYFILFCTIPKGTLSNIPTGPWTKIASIHKTMRSRFLILRLPESYFQGNRTRDAAFSLLAWNCYFLMNALSEMFVSCSVANILQIGWAAAPENEMQRGRGLHKSSVDRCATLAWASGKSNWKHT